jgi:hypothetical protein
LVDTLAHSWDQTEEVSSAGSRIPASWLVSTSCQEAYEILLRRISGGPLETTYRNMAVVLLQPLLGAMQSACGSVEPLHIGWDLQKGSVSLSLYLIALYSSCLRLDIHLSSLSCGTGDTLTQRPWRGPFERYTHNKYF